MNYKKNDIIIDNVVCVKAYKRVPQKPKLPIKDIIKFSLFTIIGSFEAAQYVKSLIRQYDNSKKEYNDFQKIKDTVEYNLDGKEYVCWGMK